MELIGDGAFIFESSQVIWSSLCDYEETKPVRGKELDFVDSLIANKSRFFAENNGASLFYFYSCDKAVAQLKSTRKQWIREG